MIETAAVIIPVILLAFVGIVGVSLVCCCCCCALPLYNLLTGCCFKNTGASSPAKYQQMVNLSTNGNYYQTHNTNVVSGGYLAEQDSIPIVEAYVVPPLEAAHHKQQPHSSGLHNSAQPQIESSSNSARFKDIWAAVLFLVNVVVIVALAFQSYGEFQQHVQDSHNNHSHSQSDTDAQTLSQLLTLFTSFVLIMVPAATVLGSLSLYVLVQNAARLIDWVNWFNIITCGFMTIICLVTFNIFGSLIFAVCTIVNYWYYWSIQDRIPFASAVIGTACTAVKKNFTALMLTSFSGLFFQLLWGLLWGVALFGVVYQPTEEKKHDDDNDAGNGLVYFLMLISLYWGAQVIQYVVSVTSGGTVASWWFQPQHPAPVRGSLFRALTTSFGSICFGSLIVAFLQALRELLRGIRKQSERRRGRDRNVALECFICLADSLLSCIENLVLYFNRFAYAYIAAYGYDFISSGRQVTALFNKRGWNAIINDNLISNAFSIQIIALAVLNALLGSGVMFALSASLHVSLTSNAIVAGAILGAILGAVVGSLMVSCLDSAVCMVFVCFAENPAALQSNHPETYHELARCWELFNPGTLTWTTASTVESGLSNPLVQARVVDHAMPATHYGVPAPSYNQQPYANQGYHQPTVPHVVQGHVVQHNPPPFNPSFRE